MSALPSSPSVRALALSFCVLALAACGRNGDGGSGSGGVTGGITGGTTGGTTGGGSAGGGSGTGRKFIIKPNGNETRDMLVAMVQAAPGDVIEFDCGYFDLSATLQLINTEDILIKGCGMDKTVLSFHSNKRTQEGILIVNVGGIVIQDLTVLDSAGNGFELRAVENGTLRRVRALWSPGGGNSLPTNDPQRITAANAFVIPADQTKPRALNVPCTDPPTQNPEVPENEGGDTTSEDYTVAKTAGRYGIYPVSSENILIEEAESVGASDAGIYVGQTNNAIIRKSRAAYNVFGFEIENVQGGEYDGNTAECNTGGFLVYDLDGLRQYGDRSRMFNNTSRMNNTYNFTEGGFVANVPPGSGMITLSYDRIDIFNNIFENNNTGGIIHASYELFPEGAGRPTERRIDWYTEGVHIFKNKFRNNGNSLPPPTTSDLQNGDVARVLPALVGLKNQAACKDPRNAAACNAAAEGSAAGVAGDPGAGGTSPAAATGYRGAHIVWDGLLDALDADCAYPKTNTGSDVPADSRGKPQHTNSDPDPACHYNKYKFDGAGARIVPDWFASCIDDDNEFSPDSLAFSNFHGLKGLEPVIAAALVVNPGDPASVPNALTAALTALPSTDLQNFASSFDQTPHKCAATYGRNLPLLPNVVIPPFVPSGDYDPAPSAARIAELCGASVAAGAVNFGAAPVNCSTLDQYHLFSDPEDPTSAPNGGGTPFVLTTKLFSDHSVKYRVVYMPPGTKATYRDAGGKSDKANDTIVFPVGTIISKTFSFRDKGAGTETPIETRLIIKRINNKGTIQRWDGLPYIWKTVGGKRIAELSLVGGTANVKWDLVDADSGDPHSGTSDSYSIPHANQCLSCHSAADKEPGSAPIGMKVRFLNRPYAKESDTVTQQGSFPGLVGVNQIQYWCANGLMTGCPTNLGVNAATQIAANLERVPTFNKPGDSGFAAGSDEDIESRARAWLEVNCQHCHNERGFAANTGFYLDSFRKVDNSFGICKGVTAAGAEGSGGRAVDIYPGDAARSVLEFRISPAATSAAAKMPPIARSVVHEEGHALIQQWINDVIVADNSKYPGSETCTAE